VSSSSRKVHPHVHGIDNRIGGRFWASGSDSKTDEEEDIMVDNLVTSMSNLLIKSPTRSLVPRPKPSSPVPVPDPSPIIPLKGMTIQVVTSSIRVWG
jgi:hypothetical protein